MAEPTQNSWWWSTSSSGDGSASSYTRADLSNISKVLGGVSGSQGVVPRFGGCYVVTSPAASTVQIGTGAALVDGKPHMCTTSGCLTIPGASGAGNTRIDRIALRADWNAGGASPQTVRIVRIPGNSATTPTAPALTQTSETTYELPLYQVTVDTAGTVSNITDERYFSSCALSGSSGIQTNASGMLVITACGLTTDKYADLSISSSKLAASAVSNDKVLNSAISSCLIAASSIYSSKIKTGAVITDTLADDAVDNTKIGNRVPMLIKRQGGNATNWNSCGTTNYTPTTVLMQCGAASGIGDEVSIVFPQAFSAIPIVILGRAGATSQAVADVATTSFIISSTGSGGVYFCNWLAIGPE